MTEYLSKLQRAAELVPRVTGLACPLALRACVITPPPTMTLRIDSPIATTMDMGVTISKLHLTTHTFTRFTCKHDVISLAVCPHDPNIMNLFKRCSLWFNDYFVYSICEVFFIICSHAVSMPAHCFLAWLCNLYKLCK